MPRLYANPPGHTYGDFRDDLERDGYAVVKGAVPKERADKYASAMFTWLEDFGLGFKREDRSTYTEEYLPIISEKGMIHGYGITHENYVWAVRSEAGVIDAFEKIYDDKDLIVSFDAVNMTLPRKDAKKNTPWPHQDQDPRTPNFRCMQGLVNLLPNGPDDGGLIVCKGSHRVSQEMHNVFKDEPDKIWAWTHEWYGVTDANRKWLEEVKGLEWTKVCAEPGDLILWDSRTVHYNLNSSTDNARFAVYTCYMPVADATQEDLTRKREAFEQCFSTTHWPNALHVGGGPPIMRGDVVDPHNFVVPKSGKPELTERAFKLTGIPYIKASA